MISSRACCGALFVQERNVAMVVHIIMELFTEVRRNEIPGEALFQNIEPVKLKHLYSTAMTTSIQPTDATYCHRFAWTAHSHITMRHRDGLTEASGPPASKDWFLFSASNFGFQATFAWTVCACCQVCVNISSAPAALMAGLWIVSTVMVKHGQASDVRPWNCPKETPNALALCVCVCVLRWVLFPLSFLVFWRARQQCEWMAGARFCFLHLRRRACGGSGLGTTVAQDPAFCQSHWHGPAQCGWPSLRGHGGP